MNNIMTIDGHKAVIAYDPDIQLFRGEFVGLNGGADFYATDVAGLEAEGRASLQVFLDICKAQGIEPYKAYSGKFNVRIPPELHAESAQAAAASGMSLNDWVRGAIDHELHAG
ncbi:MAG: type II toxin-antitoxin system HicB family antitoxin [Paludibacterium sp.]|uniref:type II toxin-antitoxin system HicB family antitoxin n=1 Tax=Paludibacterium sp. TaxID=1917523 RepID=UPI0025FC6A89|nr:type II toxin-antitoxin system HicB family antitoxin [Paludibacterium sp.]MBV8046976.1 type II toxin-antitoxin system HicB family antitoxin [Paludibacterium sp.]MBV8648108.1 type II toxin-antitoxin system HicB family antitoxin [Paludibacterium sp.]